MKWLESKTNDERYAQTTLKKRNWMTVPLETKATAGANDMKSEDVMDNLVPADSSPLNKEKITLTT